MLEKIIIAGSGGQGIMLLGKILAEAAVREEKYVTWLPSYGAEVRGGAAYCMVTISDQEIGSPYIDQADVLIIMNNPSLEKFRGRIKKKGLMIANSSLAEGNFDKTTHCLAHPFTDIAVSLGNIKVANMIALGCYISERKTVSIESAVRAIEETAPAEKKHLIEINRRALSKGEELKKC
jgi:2-oxoglutarate ferredoxin oxidoreductase subunit gamma